MNILIRHALAALGAFFASHGITSDVSTTTSILVGLLMIGGSVLWSWLGKLKWLKINGRMVGLNLSHEETELWSKLLGACVSQGIAAFAGWMQAQGFDGNVDDPVALGVFGSNFLMAKMGWHQKALSTDIPVKAFVVLGSLFLVSCTSTQKADAIIFGKRVAVSAGEAAVFVAEMQLMSMQSEYDIALMNGAPPRDILAKKLAVSAAQAALKSALKSLAKERAKLDAKQPKNVQPPSSNEEPRTQPEEPASNAPPPCDEPGECNTPACLRIVTTPERPLGVPRFGSAFSYLHP